VVLVVVVVVFVVLLPAGLGDRQPPTAPTTLEAPRRSPRFLVVEDWNNRGGDKSRGVKERINNQQQESLFGGGLLLLLLLLLPPPERI
jgi:hypothetical protein